MLLDQNTEKLKPTVSGNNQLLKGAIFSIITLVGFFFLFSFVNMDWQYFSPLAPFYGMKKEEQYMFYFVCFLFFICTLTFSLVFYKHNLLPSDILLRFGTILVVFTIVYMFYQLFSTGLTIHRKIAFNGIAFFSNGQALFNILNVALSFFTFYFLFYPLMLIFSKLFFNGYFGVAGFILCFFITAIFHVSFYYLQSMKVLLNKTAFPVADLIVILFFSLLAFGTGVLAGEEKKDRFTPYRTRPLKL